MVLNSENKINIYIYFLLNVSSKKIFMLIEMWIYILELLFCKTHKHIFKHKIISVISTAILRYIIMLYMYCALWIEHSTKLKENISSTYPYFLRNVENNGHCEMI